MSPLRALVLFAFATGCLAIGPGISHAAPPNIVLVMTDDQGWGDLSCHGNPVIDTPAIDAMLAAGGELTRFYVSPVCSPTRASLMTGRYNYRTRVFDTYRGHSMMEPAEVTVAEMLSQAGYATGIFGKWHLGDSYPLRPQDQGFDVAVVHRGGGIGQPSDPPGGEGRYTNPTLWRNGQQFVAEGYCTDVFFREATEFIDRSAAAEQPFFAYIATNAPHGPFDDVPQELYEKYKQRDLSGVVPGDADERDKAARIYAMVENIDQNVDRLRKHLRDRGLADNTLLVFMCDNGPQGVRYVGDRRGTKGTVLEGGNASPFIVEWPGHVTPGMRSDRMAAHIDVTPTLLEVAGVEPADDVKMDGRSLVPLLEGGGSDWPDRTICIQSHRGNRPWPGHNAAVLRQDWKLVRPSGFGKSQPDGDASWELYNLAEDPRERTNLAQERPELAAELAADYERWFEDVSTTRPDNYAPPRIVVGDDAERETTLTQQDWQADGEGWGAGGKWLLIARPNTRADVDVLLAQPTHGDARLALGDQVVRQQIDEPTRHIHFGQVQLPEGEFALSFAVETGGETIAPHQVRLHTKRRSGE